MKLNKSQEKRFKKLSWAFVDYWGESNVEQFIEDELVLQKKELVEKLEKCYSHPSHYKEKKVLHEAIKTIL